MAQTKQPYETTFIINASLEDTQIDALINHIQEVITRNGGEITAFNRWGRKRLAYTIKKKNNGFYANIEFDAPGLVVEQLERIYSLDENILRFLTIRLDERALNARLQSVVQMQQPEAVPTAVTSPPAEVLREPLFADETPENSPAK
ncbi:MAG: 30S ribosomal protein S6 [Ignavibacteriae bacterium]|nr:30S ribosomal protein S6 [Ignavibacteria bacterium]MBI3365223.1 30S ribosomal protein S6 [Ignavibacteriota bacterium]